MTPGSWPAMGPLAIRGPTAIRWLPSPCIPIDASTTCSQPGRASAPSAIRLTASCSASSLPRSLSCPITTASLPICDIENADQGPPLIDPVHQHADLQGDLGVRQFRGLSVEIGVRVDPVDARATGAAASFPGYRKTVVRNELSAVV